MPSVSMLLGEMVKCGKCGQAREEDERKATVIVGGTIRKIIIIPELKGCVLW